MKHIKIVLALTVIVVAMMAAVTAVENQFRPQINQAAAERANLAKDEVLPGAKDHPVVVENPLDPESSNYNPDLDVADTGIIAVFHYEGLGYVYQANFLGFASTIEYMVGFDEEGNVTGYKTLAQNDSPGYGAKIGEEATWQQLFGLTISDLEAGNFDGIAGATFTTNGWKDSFKKVINFHNNVFLGKEVIDITADFNNLPMSILKVEQVETNGVVTEYIYTVEFYSTYTSGGSTYTLSINADSTVKGISFIALNETEGIGTVMDNADFIAQFAGLSIEDATNAEFDAIGGVTVGGGTPVVTFGAFKAAFEEVYAFHRLEIDGYVAPVETPEEMLLRWYQELSSEDAVLNDTTSTYELSSGITKVEENDDFVIITASTAGFQPDSTIEFIVGFNKATRNVTGVRVLSQGDTSGIGDLIEDEGYLEQLNDMNHILAMYGEFDAPAGATYTADALKTGIFGVVDFFRVNYLGKDSALGGGEPTILERVEERAATFYPTYATITDITKDYQASHIIDGIFEIKDGTDAVLGYIFAGNGVGASYSEPTTLHFVLAINADETFQGFYLYADTDTPGRADSYYLDAYSNQFTGTNIEEDDYLVDGTADATVTHNAIQVAVRDVATYFVEVMQGRQFARPANIDTANGNLDQAFAGTNTYTSVYENYEYNGLIRNIYEVHDGTEVVGYIYYAFQPGNYQDVEFVWGVDTSGLTQSVYVIDEATSWDLAAEWASYSGSETFPDNQTFTPLFEGIQIDSILSSQVNIDSWAGVSTTTEGMRSAFETIAQYHIDNNVGGGN